MEMPTAPDAPIKKITSGHLSLKPDDAEQLGKIEPGALVRIVLTAEVRDVGKYRPQADSKEYIGDLGFDVRELKLERSNNQFEAMSKDDD